MFDRFIERFSHRFEGETVTFPKPSFRSIEKQCITEIAEKPDWGTVRDGQNGTSYIQNKMSHSTSCVGQSDRI